MILIVNIMQKTNTKFKERNILEKKSKERSLNMIS